MIDEKALDIALKKHLCTQHHPCRIAAAHLVEAYESAKPPVILYDKKYIKALRQGAASDDPEERELCRKQLALWEGVKYVD